MVDIPMFAGYVTARFHTEYNDWRYSGIFNHPKLDFKNITVEEKASPENSFSIDWDGKEKFEISNPNSGSQIKNINYTNTKDYLIRYKKIHLETFTLHLSEMQRDSVLNRVPDWKITVTDLEDKKKTLSLFYLPSKGNYQDFDGNDLPYNLDLMYATLGDGELFRVQYEFVIKALLEPYSFFEL